MPPSRRKNKNWVILAWSLNTGGALLLLAVLTIYIVRQPVVPRGSRLLSSWRAC